MAQNTDIVTEIVNFKTIDGVSADRLRKVLTTLNATYLNTINGYVDSELIQGSDDQSWIIVIHWVNDEETNEAIEEFPTSPLTAEYRSIMDPQSISLHFGGQIQTWCAAREE